MNEWEGIRFIFGHRFKTDIFAFSITMLATIALELTQAILLGTVLAAAFFLNKITNIKINIQNVDTEKLRQRGIKVPEICSRVRVAYFTGPLFFAATGIFNEAFASIGETHALILSMRGVPLIDASGLESIRRLHEKIEAQGGTLMLSGVHENVRCMFERAGLEGQICAENFFWSSD